MVSCCSVHKARKGSLKLFTRSVIVDRVHDLVICRREGLLLSNAVLSDIHHLTMIATFGNWQALV